jgi:hypothetical protein
VILECVGPGADEAEDLIVVRDADGTLLWIETGFVRHHRAVNPIAAPDRSALRLAAAQEG